MEFCVLTEPQQGATYDQLLAAALVAEQSGFIGYFCTDHLQREGGASGRPGPTDAWITLAGLARDTSRLRLGTLMTCATFRHPGHLAIMAAQVDSMSKGRIELGLGAGSFAYEHLALGIRWASAKERFEQLAEQLAVITGIWATSPGELYSFEGRYYEIRDYPALVRPAQSPRPPILVGGQGRPRSIALAAKFADEYNTDGLSATASAKVYDEVNAACELIDRDPATMTCSAVVALCCGQDMEEIARRRAAIAEKCWTDPTEILDRGAAGTPGQVIERLHAFRLAGASRIYLQLFDLLDLDHLSLVAEDVIPQLL